MKFYIGSGFKNVDRVRDLSNELKKLGWIHTYNWAEVLYTSDEEEFSLDNTVNFYQIPEIEKIVGDKETLIKRLTR